jgi:hypothetical protein
MKTNTVLLVIGVAILLFWAITTRNMAINQKQKAEQLQTQVDSLKSENFILQTQLGRYELTLDYLQEVNPKAALQASNYMNHETE